MTRHILLSTTAERSFDDVCWILERHAEELFEDASDVAVDAATKLVTDSAEEIAHFDRHARPVVEIRGLARPRPHQLELIIGWTGDPHRRFLPSVEATVLFSSVPGRRGVTAIEVNAEHSPSSTTNRHNLAVLVRRVVKGTLTRLLAQLVEQLEDYEESAFA